MHVLVATDGSVDTEKAADFAIALAGDGGKTTVATVVRVPRTQIRDLKAQYGEQAPVSADIDAEYVGSPATEPTLERSWPGEDALVQQYLGDKRIERCKPIVEAIRLRGGEAESVVEEGDEIESSLLSVVEDVGADVIIVGARGLNAFQGLLGSTGAKLVRRSPVPVLVLR